MVFERNRTNKIHVTNISVTINWDEIQKLFGSYGRIVHIEKDLSGKQEETFGAYITYETPEHAQAAVQKLNGFDVQGYLLKVEYSMDRGPGSRSPRGGGRGGNPKNMPYSGNQGSPLRGSDFPLRILVLSDMVGAIIGRSGGTIRQITQQSRARVDVHRKENSGAFDKDEMYSVQVITIYGNPENCSLACQKILEVMQQEANNTNRGEVPLKILAHNNLIGRIIGKNGNTIKRIMETTDTKIIVSSSIHDVNSFNFEKVITIKGKLENICKAEQMISSKLRQSYENDLAAMAPSAMMFPPGLHPMNVFSAINQGYPPNRPGGGPPPPYRMYGNPQVSPYNAAPMMYSPGAPPPNMEPLKETVHLYIPNSAVGAIISTGGSTIRDMISSSGAIIKVAQTNKDEPIDRQAERKVTITGNPDAQWKKCLDNNETSTELSPPKNKSTSSEPVSAKQKDFSQIGLVPYMEDSSESSDESESYPSQNMLSSIVSTNGKHLSKIGSPDSYKKSPQLQIKTKLSKSVFSAAPYSPRKNAPLAVNATDAPQTPVSSSSSSTGVNSATDWDVIETSDLALNSSSTVKENKNGSIKESLSSLKESKNNGLKESVGSFMESKNNIINESLFSPNKSLPEISPSKHLSKANEGSHDLSSDVKMLNGLEIGFSTENCDFRKQILKHKIYIPEDDETSNPFKRKYSDSNSKFSKDSSHFEHTKNSSLPKKVKHAENSPFLNSEIYIRNSESKGKSNNNKVSSAVQEKHYNSSCDNNPGTYNGVLNFDKPAISPSKFFYNSPMENNRTNHSKDSAMPKGKEELQKTEPSPGDKLSINLGNNSGSVMQNSLIKKGQPPKVKQRNVVKEEKEKFENRNASESFLNKGVHINIKKENYIEGDTMHVETHNCNPIFYSGIATSLSTVTDFDSIESYAANCFVNEAPPVLNVVKKETKLLENRNTSESFLNKGVNIKMETDNDIEGHKDCNYPIFYTDIATSFSPMPDFYSVKKTSKKECFSTDMLNYFSITSELRRSDIQKIALDYFKKFKTNSKLEELFGRIEFQEIRKFEKSDVLFKKSPKYRMI